MKLKKSLKLVLTLLILLFGIFICYQKFLDKNEAKYSEEVISTMKELGVYKDIKDKEYSKTLEYVVLSNDFYSKHLNDYYEINYIEKNDFSTIINTLLDNDYSPNEINSILENLSDVNINKLLSSPYVDLTNYYKISNLNVDKINEYEDYKNNKNVSYEDAVTQVNIGLNNKYYTEIKDIENPADLTVLVNKYNALPADYEPDDLVSLSNGSQFKLRKVAAEAYEKLIDYAEDNGVEVLPFSGYRSYSTQKVIYNNHVNNNGRERADTYSARPGHSEHQLGLAVDIRSKGYELKRLTPDDAKWINENCSKFGFIVRYTKEDEFITGYMEETWHLRYVGKNIAEKVMNLGITYDEYYDLYIKTY